LFENQLKIIENCQNLKPTEAVLSSYASAISKYDMTNCRVLKEPLSFQPVVIYFRKNHFLVKSIDAKLSLFKSAEMIDYFVSSSTKTRPSANPQERKLKVLMLHDLSGALKVWMFGLVFATLACGIENLSGFFLKRRDLIIVL
jgi:hypothetical protein